ncbi:MAG: nucleotidyltransferase [Verrucomicrobia bacterium]|nr:nucleotidyltransferase [Verrucomicrobiota bacterium]
MHDLHLLLQRLADEGVDFVVVGGYAGMIHGSALVTQDVDVCAVLSAENVEKIRRAFADIHPVHRQTHRLLSFLEHPAPGQPPVNLYLRTDKGAIDILSSILGIGDFERLRKNAVDLPMFDRTYPVISIEDLIAAKEAVGRDKDLLAAKELRAIAAKRRLAEG